MSAHQVASLMISDDGDGDGVGNATQTATLESRLINRNSQSSDTTNTQHTSKLRSTTETTANAKLWNMKAKLPYVPTTGLPNFDSFDVDSLSCGCACTECKTTYKAYWVMSSECEELKHSLKEERHAMNMTIKEVRQLELAHAKALKALKDELTAEQQKYKVLEGQLNEERRCRIEEVYKTQKQVEEATAMISENADLKERIVLLLGDMSSLQGKYDHLHGKSKEAAMVNRNLLKQLENDNMEIQQLELKNTTLRQSLYDSTVMNQRPLGRGNNAGNSIATMSRSRSQPHPPSTSSTSSYGYGGSYNYNYHGEQGTLPQLQPLRSSSTQRLGQQQRDELTGGSASRIGYGHGAARSSLMDVSRELNMSSSRLY